jgi:hypothetical protein
MNWPVHALATTLHNERLVHVGILGILTAATELNLPPALTKVQPDRHPPLFG